MKHLLFGFALVLALHIITPFVYADTPQVNNSFFANLLSNVVKAGKLRKEDAAKVNPLSFKFVPIPEGLYTRSFEMGATDVTQALFDMVLGYNPSTFGGVRFGENACPGEYGLPTDKNKGWPGVCINNPAESLSWEDQQLFIEQLNKLQHEYKYRLPDKTEWEYAARAEYIPGVRKNATWFFGENEEQLQQYAWYDKNSSNHPHPVAQLKPSPNGLYDVYGNVMQSTKNWYAGGSNFNLYEVRGGGFDYSAPGCTSTFPIVNATWRRWYDYGFRLIRKKWPPQNPGESGSKSKTFFKDLLAQAVKEGKLRGEDAAKVNPLSFEFVPIPAGPETKEFEMGVTDVTQTLYYLVQGNNPSRFVRGRSANPEYDIFCPGENALKPPGFPAEFSGEANQPFFLCINNPVEMVSWNDADEFIDTLNSLQSLYTYRLPNEKEWEYAARAEYIPGVPKNAKYFFGNDDSLLAQYAWPARLVGSTSPVAKLKPSPNGLYDVYGNVSQWMKDLYNANISYVKTFDYGTLRGCGSVGISGSCGANSHGSWARYDRHMSFGFRLIRESRAVE